MRARWIITIAVCVTAPVVGIATYFVTRAQILKTADLPVTINEVDSQASVDQTLSGETTGSETDSSGVSVSSTTAATTTSAAAPAAAAPIASCKDELSVAKLKEAVFVTETEHWYESSYQLTDGKYLDTSNAAFPVSIQLTDFIACDTVTGRDVAVIGKVNRGGTGYEYILEIYSPKADFPLTSALTSLGDRVVIKSLTMANGVIDVNMLTQGPSDPSSGPTIDTKRTYTHLMGTLTLQ